MSIFVLIERQSSFEFSTNPLAIDKCVTYNIDNLGNHAVLSREDKMTLLEINSIIEGKILTKNPDLNLELGNAFSSDVISHIVTYASDKSILITAVYNPQILKTAEMKGVQCVILIGIYEPEPSLIALANSLGITLLRSTFSMYVTCGKLYSSGLQGAF